MTPLLMDKSLPFSIWSFCVLFKKSFPFSTLLHCWVRMKIGVATMEQSMESLQKTKNRTTIWPCSSTPGHISEQNYNSKIYMQPYVHGSTVHNSQVMEATSMSIDNWIDKENVAHIYNGEGNGTPLQISYLRNPMDRGAWHAIVHRVAKSWLWLSNEIAYNGILLSHKKE